MGFDDIDFLDYISPRLSTIYNSVEEVSKKAVELLLSQIQGETVPQNSYENYRIIDGRRFKYKKKLFLYLSGGMQNIVAKQRIEYKK